MKSKLSFSSPSLQEINTEAEAVISTHLQNLDRVSNDIKALEDQLATSGIPYTFYYVLSSEDRRYNQNEAFHDELIYTTESAEQTDSCLVWGKCEDGQYRLSHNVYVTINEVAKNYDKSDQYAKKVLRNGEPELHFSRPLIETKAHFRVQIEKELVHFYKAIIEALKTKRDQECIFEYSPNYNQPFPLAKIDLNFHC